MSVPPFSITPRVLSLSAQITRLVGRYEGFLSPLPQPQLRKKNSVRTIHSSLAIEGNTLSLEQVSDVLEGHRVIGAPAEIQEVKNAMVVYDTLGSMRPGSEKHFLKAHGRLMKGLIPDNGEYRSTNVGVVSDQGVTHVAPPHGQISRLMGELFEFLKDSQLHPLIASSVFHYEVEFIHPFSDGNGRMGRLWQHGMLAKYHPLFQYVPMESVIREKQARYYEVLGECDQGGDSTGFIEFALQAILEALEGFLVELKPAPLSAVDRMEKARDHFGRGSFSRKEYLGVFKTISSATASRDLRKGVTTNALRKTGDRALAVYEFV
jgi:Fic family protein